jgi:hypothetical protein
MVVMAQQDVRVGDVYVRKHWRHGVLWRVQITGAKDDLVSFQTIEYSGESAIDTNTETITLVSKFLQQYEKEN